MVIDTIKALETVNHGNEVISVALTRDHVRPESLAGTRQFLIEAISAKGGRHGLVVDVSHLSYEDMVHGLQYRNGLSRNETSGLHIHNPAGGNYPALIHELRHLDGSLQLQAKSLYVAGLNETTRKMMHKTKIDRQLTLRDTVEEALEEARGAPAEARA